MKNKNLKLFILISFILLAGCSNDQYSIEKKYYQVNQQALKIFKNPVATPPNELAKVVNDLQGFASKYPKSRLAVEAEFKVASLYMAKEEYPQARQELAKVLRNYEKADLVCAEAVFLIGKSYEMQNDWDHALLQYKRIMREYPLTIRGLNVPVYIALYYKTKFQPDRMMDAFREAINHYNSLSQKYPDTPLALQSQTLVAQCYMALSEPQNAIDTLNLIVDKYKSKIAMDRVLLNIAFIYTKDLKDVSKAKLTLQRLIHDYPKSPFSPSAKKLIETWEKGK